MRGWFTLRGLLAASLGCVAFAVSYATAASLSMASTDLGAGFAAVLPCDLDGIAVTPNVFQDTGPDARWEVSSLSLAGIAPECIGGRLSLAVVDASGTVLSGGGPATVSASSLEVDLVPDPPALAVTGIRLIIVGP